MLTLRRQRLGLPRAADIDCHPLSVRSRPAEVNHLVTNEALNVRDWVESGHLLR